MMQAHKPGDLYQARICGVTIGGSATLELAVLTKLTHIQLCELKNNFEHAASRRDRLLYVQDKDDSGGNVYSRIEIRPSQFAFLTFEATRSPK